MDIETLKRFCSRDTTSTLTAPFLQCGYLWATNGVVIIGIPSSTGEKRDTPDTTPFTINIPETGWLNIPEVEVAPCEFCNGKVVDIKCGECNGVGAVTLKNKWTEYDGIECGSCDGFGELHICPRCSQTGVQGKGVTLNGVYFGANILHFIKDLPGVQICPTEPMKFAYLRFNGGIGAIMPAIPREGE